MHGNNWLQPLLESLPLAGLLITFSNQKLNKPEIELL